MELCHVTIFSSALTVEGATTESYSVEEGSYRRTSLISYPEDL
jgi:hypothetical protein